MAESGLGFPSSSSRMENAASIGVSVVRSAAELPEAARLAQSQTHKTSHGLALDITLLAQEHVDGDEFSVETVISHGEIHHLTITEKLTTGGTSRAELGHTVPAESAPGVGEALYAAATAAIRALGLRNGVAHTEVKIGSGGAPKVIEVGARPPGDHIMRLVREALGIDEARAFLQTVLGRMAGRRTPARGGRRHPVHHRTGGRSPPVDQRAPLRGPRDRDGHLEDAGGRSGRPVRQHGPHRTDHAPWSHRGGGQQGGGRGHGRDHGGDGEAVVRAWRP